MKKHFWFRVTGFGFLVVMLVISSSSCNAQPLSQKEKFTRADTLRGTITPERAWWDVMRYDISVTPDYLTKTIKGEVVISYRITNSTNNGLMQIDLQQPMEIDDAGLVVMDAKNKTASSTPEPLKFTRDGNVFY